MSGILGGPKPLGMFTDEDGDDCVGADGCADEACADDEEGRVLKLLKVLGRALALEVTPGSILPFASLAIFLPTLAIGFRLPVNLSVILPLICGIVPATIASAVII